MVYIMQWNTQWFSKIRKVLNLWAILLDGIRCLYLKQMSTFKCSKTSKNAGKKSFQLVWICMKDFTRARARKRSQAVAVVEVMAKERFGWARASDIICIPKWWSHNVKTIHSTHLARTEQFIPIPKSFICTYNLWLFIFDFINCFQFWFLHALALLNMSFVSDCRTILRKCTLKSIGSNMINPYRHSVACSNESKPAMQPALHCTALQQLTATTTMWETAWSLNKRGNHSTDNIYGMNDLCCVILATELNYVHLTSLHLIISVVLHVLVLKIQTHLDEIRWRKGENKIPHSISASAHLAHID